MRTCSFAIHPRGLLIGLPSVLFLSAFAAGPKVSQPKPLLTLQGNLIFIQGIGPALHTQKKDYRLASKEPSLLHTLQDKRLVGRELRLEGTANPDGRFNVEKLYTVHGGKVYRVRYFCEVCNIEALEPGNCVCCQQPTELQEIPVNENPSGH